MRSKSIRLVTLGAIASLAIAGSAQAKNGADDPAGQKGPRDDAAIHLRHGADDPANHNVGDDRITKAGHRHRGHHRARGARHGADDVQPHFKRGADDPVGDDRGGHGLDDPAGHR